MKSSIHRCWYLPIILLLCGCNLVGSKHPLSDSTDSVVDPVLIGKWAQLDKDGKINADDVVTVSRKPGSETTLLLTGDSAEKRAIAYTVQLGDDRYLSFGEEHDDSPHPWTILRYKHQSDGTVHLWLLDHERVLPFVEKQVVAGEIIRPEEGGDQQEIEVNLTASSSELQKFFAAHGRTCYLPDPAVYKRIQPAKANAADKELLDAFEE